MTPITPNYLHNTTFKEFSNSYLKDIWDYYCDDGLVFEYILDKDKNTNNKIDGHYLALSYTGDYIYVNRNCNNKQYDMLIFEDMRKEVISWLVDVSHVTEVDECSLFKAVKLMDLYFIHYSNKVMKTYTGTQRQNTNIIRFNKLNYQCIARYVFINLFISHNS